VLNSKRASWGIQGKKQALSRIDQPRQPRSYTQCRHLLVVRIITLMKQLIFRQLISVCLENFSFHKRAAHPPTITMLGSRKLGNLIKDPVPSDIEIAQSVDPLPIADIARAVGILDDVRLQ